jgi:hypothetical protein
LTVAREDRDVFPDQDALDNVIMRVDNKSIEMELPVISLLSQA